MIELEIHNDFEAPDLKLFREGSLRSVNPEEEVVEDLFAEFMMIDYLGPEEKPEKFYCQMCGEMIRLATM